MSREMIEQWGEEADSHASTLFQTYEAGWDHARDERFAKIAAKHEREHCAKVCEVEAAVMRTKDMVYGASRCAQMIRERGGATQPAVQKD